jgi:fructose-1,6-bisphosphatase I
MHANLDMFVETNKDEINVDIALNTIITDIAHTALKISKLISNAYVQQSNLLGYSSKYNRSGDNQTNLDILAHEIFIEAFSKNNDICAVISEEANDPIIINEIIGKYIITIDPIDGSSNIKSVCPIGSIISVYERISSKGKKISNIDLFQPGTRQVLSLYVLYSTVIVLVYSVGQGVNIFTYDEHMSKFVLTHKNFTPPKTHKVYSINESYIQNFPFELKQELQNYKKQKLTARYSGSLVLDIHRILMNGGIFIYPSTLISPSGKLRLIIECNPIAFLIEQLGGTATQDGHNKRILELVPQAIHQTTPLYIKT